MGPPRHPCSADRCADGARRRYWLAMDRNRDRGSGPARTGCESRPARASRASRGAVRAAVGGPGRLCGSCLRSRGQRQDDARALVARGRAGSLSTRRGSRSSSGERDAQHFWLAVIDALAAALGGSVEPLGPTPGFRGEAVVERLLEDLRSVEEPLVLVIDDLHELQSPEALTWLELFITRRPAGLRIVLTSRAEPQPEPAPPAPRRRADRDPSSRTCASLPTRPASCCGPARSSSPTRRWRCFTSGRKAGSRASAWRRSRSPGIRTRSGSCATSPAASAASRDI